MTSECTNKNARLIPRLLKVGKWESVLVTWVDYKEGLIDLSRKRVRAEDIKECEDRFNRAMKVNNIAKQVAYELDEDLNEIYTRVVWPLDKAYAWAYDAFMMATETPDEVFAKISIP